MGHIQDVGVEVGVGESRSSHSEKVADDVLPSYEEPEPQNDKIFVHCYEQATMQETKTFHVVNTKN